MAECSREALGLGPGEEVAPYTEEDWRERYREMLVTMECLRDEGIDVDDPPSEDQYVDSIMAGDGGTYWHPYDGLVLQAGPIRYEELRELCPQPDI